MIAEGSREGSFSPQLLAPRVMLGTCLQLLLVMAVGRQQGPQGTWRPASLQVLRSGRRCLGFALLTGQEALPSGRPRTQIALFKVASGAQSRGLGSHMLDRLLASLPQGSAVETDCLPASQGMQRLLARQGFRRQGGAQAGAQRWRRVLG